eukprot:58050-Amphidinium_carterae.1
MGRYKGGRVWIEAPHGRHPPPNLPDSPLHGQYHETRYRWVMFDPKRSHAVEQCIGSRLSVLQEFGFPCKQLAKICRNFQLNHICCNAWFKDLDEAVPDQNMPNLADVTHAWERHLRQGHLAKLPSCPACQRESDPRTVHKRTKALERKIGVLHGDLAHMGPGLHKYLWVLVLAAVVEVENNLTVIPFYYPLENKASEKVLKCVSEAILWVKNFQYGRFIQRFMSDNRGEFTSHPFIHGMHKLGVTLTTAPSYQPQGNGMAECWSYENSSRETTGGSEHE